MRIEGLSIPHCSAFDPDKAVALLRAARALCDDIGPRTDAPLSVQPGDLIAIDDMGAYFRGFDAVVALEG